MTSRFTVPVEILASSEWFDEHGFATPGAIPEKRDVRDLLSDGIAVVTGEPWIGKTYVSQQLYDELERRKPRFADRLSLEDGTRSVEPTWWREWRSSRDEAWWIVDALDEALHVESVSVGDVLRPLLALSPDERRRLHVVIFTRDDDSLTAIQDVLGATVTASFHRLLPFDEAEARRIVVGAERFNRVLQQLRDPALRELARFEPVLRVLADSADQRSRSDVLKEVLATLCAEHSGRRRERSERWNRDEMLRAASRIAAVMLLCDIATVQLELGRGQLRLAQVFPSNPSLRAAAELLRHTSLFQKGPSGHRFRQRFVMELLAAFGLRDLSPEALRLLTRGNAPAFPARLSALEKILRDVHPRAFQDHLPDLTHTASNRSSKWAARKVDELLDVVGMGRSSTATRVEALALFNVPGVERVLDRRLANKAISEGGREMLFRIAFACELRGLSGRAVQIALDNDEPAELRVTAAYFATRFGGRDAVVLLRPILDAPDQPTRLRARIIQVLVEEGMLAPLDAAAITPEPYEHLYDAREAAVSAIVDRLSADDARRVVDDWTGTSSLPATVTDAVRERLRSRSAELLMATASATPDDARRVARLLRLESRDVEVLDRELFKRLSADPALRRALYKELVDTDAALRVSLALEPTDAQWLLEFAGAHPSECALDDLYRLMRSVPPDDLHAQAIREFFRAHHPAEASARDARWSRAEEERRKFEERRPVRERRTPVPISEIVERVLRAEMKPSQQVQTLGLICFVEGAFRPDDVAGSFSDLSPATQALVVARVRELLAVAEPEPLPLPEARTFSGGILYEAAAFRAALTFDPDRSWLVPAIAERWLPAVLFASHDDVPTVVSELLKSAPDATWRCALAALQRELRRPDRVYLARQLPEETWSDEFAERVAELVIGSGDSLGRGSLLRALAIRSPSVATRVSRQLLLDAASARSIRIAAADVLLAVDPAELGWEHFEPLIQRGEDVEMMTGLLHSLGGEPFVNPAELPAGILSELAQRLWALYPRETDPERFGPRWIGRSDEARDTRDRILSALLDRSANSVDAARVRERLAASDRWFAQWSAAVLASRAVDAVLDAMAPPPPVPTPEEVVRALDEEYYRPIRTEVDLWRLVTEILRDAVGPTVGYDVDLLYNLPARRSTGTRPRRDEGKLQAYVRRRLEDLFPQYWGRVSLELLREPQSKFRRRYDLLVVANLGGSGLARVAVELKWSDDRRCETALTEQLVKKYLIDAGRLHGVYLVGWCGSPKGATWDERMRKHAAQIKRASASQAGLRVAATYLKCSWQDPSPDRRGRATSRKRRRGSGRT